MTLRARLGWGLLAIALVLIVPLLISLRSLEHLYETSRLLRDREFAASLLLGSFRERTDDARRAEDALLFIHDQKSATRMQREIDGLVALTDSLDRYHLDLSASQIRSSLDALRSAAREEYEQASAGRSTVAEMISQQRTRPAIAAVDSSLGVSATLLRNRTRNRVADATNETLNADLDYQLKIKPNQETEFGRLAASYQTMARQLAELERLRAEFVGVASHELKTPINVILGYVELLQEGIHGELTPQQKEVLKTINKQANSLTRLVKRLLDISRFEASGGKIDVREVDLRHLLNTLESTFSVLAAQREIAFKVNCAEALPAKVHWDEDRINEVLGNLLSNAFKFTERGGEVSLSVGPTDSMVAITVADTGAGISAAQLPHIFDKFYQADNQAQAATKGTGLGLAIAKEIVEAHDGQITVESRVSEGTTFVVTLPIEPSGGKVRHEHARKAEVVG